MNAKQNKQIREAAELPVVKPRINPDALAAKLRRLMNNGVSPSAWTVEDILECLDEAALLRRTIRATNDNACAWHSGEDGKARALNVIAIWTSEALAGRLHPSVEAVTEALDDAALPALTQSALPTPSSSSGGGG